MTAYRTAILATLVLVVLRATLTPDMPWWVAWGPLLLCGAWSLLVLAACFVDISRGSDQ